mgnify:CR=1 FL=1
MPDYFAVGNHQQPFFEKHVTKVIYCNVMMTCVSFFTLFILAIEISPVVNDAGILINDASNNLKDFSIILPEISTILPEARNTTRILGQLVPEIKEGMSILHQQCMHDKNCHF